MKTKLIEKTTLKKYLKNGWEVLEEYSLKVLVRKK